MFGSSDLTSADKAAVASIKRAKAAAKQTDAARTQRQPAGTTPGRPAATLHPFAPPHTPHR